MVHPQAFAAVGLLGITVVVSSGDSGAHGATDENCASTLTRPDWPAASPYVLSVGATQVAGGGLVASPKSTFCKNYDCAGSGSEVVCSYGTGALITSGGGFSNVAPRPSWQAAAVSAYLASGALLPGPSNFNASSRGYPDVAAIGHNVSVPLLR
jgi:tripeptidyl-peptidase-1